MSKNIRKTKYAVTYIEYGDSVDGRPRCLGVFDTRGKAIKELKLDMETYANSDPEAEVFMDYDGWAVWADEESKWQSGCAWNINKIEIQSKQVIKKGEQQYEVTQAEHVQPNQGVFP